MSSDDGTVVITFITPKGHRYRVCRFSASMGIQRSDWEGKPLYEELGAALVCADSMEQDNPTEYGITRMIHKPWIEKSSDLREHMAVIQAWVVRARQMIIQEYGELSCPHEGREARPNGSTCQKICECGHYCKDHVWQDPDWTSKDDSKRQILFCSGDGCQCQKYVELDP